MSHITAATFLHTFRNSLRCKVALSYPRSGGIGAIASSLADVIIEHGGDVICNTKVNRVQVKDHRVTGVIANVAPFGSSFAQELTLQAPTVISSIPVASIFPILPSEECDASFVGAVEHWRNVHQQITIGLMVAAKRDIIKPSWFIAVYMLPYEAELPADAVTGPFRFMGVPTFLSPSSAPPGYDLLYIEANSYNNHMMRRKGEIQDELRSRLFEMYPQLKHEREWMVPYVVSCRTYAQTIGYSRMFDVQVPGIDGMHLCGDQVAGYGEGGKNGLTRAFSSALCCANRIRENQGMPSIR
jgi:phytoene dehydrogenase-like protein